MERQRKYIEREMEDLKEGLGSWGGGGEGEERRTVGEMESVDGLRKGLPATLGGWIWEPRAV